MRLSVVLILLLASVAASAVEPPDPKLSFDVPREIREWYRNPDGSCVQCSIGMCGIDQHIPAAASLLWKTEFGPAERGGSGPERVARYAQSRGLKIHNITGRPVYEWLTWAAANGRGAAVTCSAQHMQTFAGHDPRTKSWYVCNNNSPQKIDTYDDLTFHRLCDVSGPWCVVLDYPPHPARPIYRQWWKEGVEVNRAIGYDFQDKEGPKLQLAQWQPRDLPSNRQQPEVNVKEVRRRGDFEQAIGDSITSHPVIDAFGECMAMPNNDSDKWHIWCVLDPTGKRSQRLMMAWQSSAELRAFAVPGQPAESWAHFNAYYSDDASQSWRWERLQMTGTPTVICQPPISRRYGPPDTVVFQAVYGDDPKDLATALRQAILNYLAVNPPRPRPDAITAPCPGPDCPNPFKPGPRPNPAPRPDEDGGGRRPLDPLIPPPDSFRPSIWSPVMTCIYYFVGLLAVLAVTVSFLIGCMVLFFVLRWAWRRAVASAAAARPPASPANPSQPSPQ